MPSNVRNWLAASKKRGMELGLERVFAAHKALISTPYDATVLHVAGSNGKGTLCATIAAHLKYLGHSTVLFTSPHLIRVEERVRVDGRPIDAHRFDGFLAEIQGIETQLNIELTFFEITFLVACLCAQRIDAEYFIVETGLGGRYDATRILPADASIITSLSLEHRDVLGDTLSLIAAEKAAIARPQKPLIVRKTSDEEAIEAIKFEAEHAGRSELNETPAPASLQWVKIPENVSVQQEAFLLAEAVLSRMKINTDQLSKAVKGLNWPGRFQEIPAPWSGSMLFDSAHNPSGLVRLLPQLVQQVKQRESWSLVFGCTPQHDLVEFCEPLLDLCHQHSPDTIVLTKPQHGRYPAVSVKDLCALNWPSSCAIEICENAVESLKFLNQLQPEFTVAIGSLYLVGELYEALNLWGSEFMELFPANTQRGEG